MKDTIFNDCLEHQKNNCNKPFWNELAEKYRSEGYKSGEQLRSSFKREKKKRGMENELIPSLSDSETSSYEEGKDFINIICSSPRVMNKEDIIKQFKIDESVWEIDKFQVRTHEVHRSDVHKTWVVENGVVVEGNVQDSGKLLVVPLYSVSVSLKRKKEQWTEKSVDFLFESIKNKDLYSLPEKSYKNENYKHSFLLPLVDLHLGLKATKQACGNEYNIDIAEQLYYDVINKSIEKIKNIKLKEIVFLVGNDFLNSDNLNGTTVKGTSQDNSDFWFTMIDKGIEMIIRGTNSLLEYAPVKIMHVPANHDEHSMYGIMKAVEKYYEGNKNVSVDVSPLPRKYYRFGKSVVGFVHDMPIKKCLEIMSVEAKEYWTECNKFFWMMGHLHTGMEYQKEGLLEIYRLPTISGNSRWSNNSSYIQTEKKNQCFLFDEENGIVDIYNIYV